MNVWLNRRVLREPGAGQAGVPLDILGRGVSGAGGRVLPAGLGGELPWQRCRSVSLLTTLLSYICTVCRLYPDLGIQALAQPAGRGPRQPRHRHLQGEPQRYKHSCISCPQEYSTDEGDPYYPVPNPRNQELYAKYQALAQQEQGVTFVGRLASYKYFNMDQAILNALELFDKLVEERKLLPKKSS